MGEAAQLGNFLGPTPLDVPDKCVAGESFSVLNTEWVDHP
jgi:hypothetical protein